VLDHLDDLESDLSAFHRVDDMDAMPARRFLVLAGRLVHYGGALQAAVKAEAEEAQNAPVPATRAMYDANPELKGVGTFAEVKAPGALPPEAQAYVDAHPELQAPPPR
jgi:hypothetical protein